ncbi:MAG: tetratricopeptide repeat protein [Bacteroidales bacterium]|nr:tetratricopeptide repeat protein [Bacteroidales bacterium]
MSVIEPKSIAAKQLKIVSLILKNQLGIAFKELGELAYSSRQGNLISGLENLEQTYKSVLKYSFGYAKDPERNKIFSSIKRQLIELTDDISAHIIESSDEWLILQRRGNYSFSGLSEQEKLSLIDEMAIEKEFNDLLTETNTPSENSAKENSYSELLSGFFNLFWLTNNYSSQEKLLAGRFFQSAQIPWFDKSVIVSAITLSGLRHFDQLKTDILFSVYSNSENQVKQRALLGLVLILIMYDTRLGLYEEVINRIKALEAPEIFERQVEQIVLQLIRANETEKVTAKVQNEIIPEVMKLRPEIEEKLRLDELLSDKTQEDKNPDWEKFFGDTPNVYKKLEEFSNLQMDGSDVFMGAFSMLKRFGFFDKLSNWFLPFYKEHPEIQKSVKGVAKGNFDWGTFFDGIEQAPVLCNSDKYSFAFNLGFMPDMQKTMMLEFFNAELQQMKEVSISDNKHNSTAVDKVIFAQYMQDLYRFFKLHPRKGSFIDIFGRNNEAIYAGFVSRVLPEKKLRHIAEFYFQKDYFKEAIDIFTGLTNELQSFELLEKTGFCYQKLGNYEKAIEFYKKAEILDAGRNWLLLKLGFCYRNTGQFDKAVEYYKRIEALEPDNLEVQAFLGQLYIDKEDYETALKYYFKVEYLKPDLVKVQRPIAWCSFSLKKTEQALRYFIKVAETDGKRVDYLNLGHCYWSMGNLTAAIDSYRMALKLSGNNINWFTNAMYKDAIYLNSYQIEGLDVALMVDYLTWEPV